VRAPVNHAARYDITSPLTTVTPLLPSGKLKPSAPETKPFSTLIVAAHTPVYLRINTPITRNAARLTSGLPGSALTVRGSHPLDD